MTRVTVVNYGVGNLHSVRHALEHVGATVEVTNDPDRIARADRLVLPGVGAFAHAMTELRRHHLIDPVLTQGKSGRPLLGICLGMQLLFEASEEFGRHEGLGLVPGQVAAIPRLGTNGAPHRIPHIGWSPIESLRARSWDGTILDAIAPGSYVYFVHSFTAHPVNAEYLLADCIYNGHHLAAVVRAGSIMGCQFHPEKSGEIGLKILQSFINL